MMKVSGLTKTQLKRSDYIKLLPIKVARKREASFLATDRDKLLAHLGLAIAQYNVGACYETGVGVEQNSAISTLYLNKARGQGTSFRKEHNWTCYFISSLFTCTLLSQ